MQQRPGEYKVEYNYSIPSMSMMHLGQYPYMNNPIVKPPQSFNEDNIFVPEQRIQQHIQDDFHSAYVNPSSLFI